MKLNILFFIAFSLHYINLMPASVKKVEFTDYSKSTIEKSEKYKINMISGVPFRTEIDPLSDFKFETNKQSLIALTTYPKNANTWFLEFRPGEVQTSTAVEVIINYTDLKTAKKITKTFEIVIAAKKKLLPSLTNNQAKDNQKKSSKESNESALPKVLMKTRRLPQSKTKDTQSAAKTNSDKYKVDESELNSEPIDIKIADENEA